MAAIRSRTFNKNGIRKALEIRVTALKSRTINKMPEIMMVKRLGKENGINEYHGKWVTAVRS